MFNDKRRRCFLSAGLMLCLLFTVLTGCGDDGESALDRGTEWTIMYYGDGDCNLEAELLDDVAEMKSGFIDGQGVNLVVLFDRINYYSSDKEVFGEDFTDSRLYRITGGRVWRLSGSTQFPEITKTSVYEANMGDAETLRKFIRFCKGNYPARNYALILSNHGGGAQKKKAPNSSLLTSLKNSSITESICWDESDGDDFLYTAEISDTLSSEDSVQLFGLDACFMSSVEFAYQFRNDSSNSGFKAEIMVASPPSETGFGWDYLNILKRLQNYEGNNGEADKTLGGYELYYSPSTLTSAELGAIIVEEQRDSTAYSGNSENKTQALSCIDLSKVNAVKTAVDTMASALISEKSDLEALRGSGTSVNLLNYFDETDVGEWIAYACFDLYNMTAAINGSSDFSTDIQNKAAAVSTAVDSLILYSFGNSAYPEFLEGKSGMHIFFPDGDAQRSADINRDGTNEYVNHWYWQDWYNALDIRNEYTGAPYGKLAWCIDGATASNGAVENWFELLDCWFDTQTIGGLSNYNYYSY